MSKQGNPFVELLPRELLALFGAHNLKDPYEADRVSLSPQKIQVHKDWNPNLESYDADIAIITFRAGAIRFSTFVQPICLWNEKNYPTQTEGQVGHWGQSENMEKYHEDIPTKLKVPIHTNENCFLTTKDLVDLASNRNFCAGKGDGTGICTGVSGGGLSIKVGSTFYFRGIVSSGLHDQISCDVSKFAIFTDVLKFKPWIDQRMSEDGEILTPKVVRGYLRCEIGMETTGYLNVNGEPRNLLTCYIRGQKIDGEGFSVTGVPNQNIQRFVIIENKEVKFLPENIVEYFPGLIRYQVIDCSIRTVTGEHFKGLTKLEVLFLQFNEIETIDGDSFKDLTKLEHLILFFNKIKTIDPNLLQSLENLSQLMINSNEIEFLDEKIFDNLPNIRLITLGGNKLSTIPANLFKNNLKQKYIELGNNKIQTISPTMFDHLKNLIYVDLRNNVCVNDFYRPNQFSEMKNVLSINCTSPV